MCDCIEKFDEKLKEHNTKLSTAFRIRPTFQEDLIIQTEVIEKKRGAKAMMVVPTYCPFCGEKYALPQSPALEAGSGGTP